MPFTFEETGFAGLYLIKPKVFRDDRGWFCECFNESAFAAGGLSVRLVQENHSYSGPKVIRGLHFQKGTAAQGKLVRVCAGRVFDVAVDIRRNSPTYRRWFGATLSAGECRMVFIPQGFAHGFAVLGDGAEVVYQVTAEYSPRDERGICWDDPDLGIDWPVKGHPVISERDRNLPLLREVESELEEPPG